MSSGCSNLRWGNARTTLKGGGGSGEPTTREVVQGWRTAFACSPALGSAVSPATSESADANRAMQRRRPPREIDGIVPLRAKQRVCESVLGLGGRRDHFSRSGAK